MIHASVIGAGPMGSSVAGELAQHGIKTRLYDIMPNKAAEAVQELTERLPELIRCGLMDKHCEFASLIKPCNTLRECVQDAEIVFEAVVENAAVKSAVFGNIACLCPSSCIIASNTLTLDVGVLTEHIPNPERALAVRFLHPVFGVQGVEITPTRRTSAETRVIVESFLTQSLGKTPFYRTTGTPRFALLPHAEQVGSLARSRSDPPRSSHRTGRALSPEHATWSNSSAAPRAEEMAPQFATWAHQNTPDAFRLPDHLHRQQLTAAEAACRDRAGPGGPGAVGAGPLPMVVAPVGGSSGRNLFDGQHGGPGSEGTGVLHIPFVTPNTSPSSYQGAGGIGRMGTGPCTARAIQTMSQGFIPQRAIQTMSQGFVPEGPGGPGAFRSTPVRSDHALPPTQPMPSGPGGPGAFGTPMDVSDSQPSNDMASGGSNEDGGSGEAGAAQACVVCMDAARNSLLCPCHHFCVCAACAKAICSRRGECPVCRGAIESVIPVFVP